MHRFDVLLAYATSFVSKVAESVLLVLETEDSSTVTLGSQHFSSARVMG